MGELVQYVLPSGEYFGLHGSSKADAVECAQSGASCAEVADGYVAFFDDVEEVMDDFGVSHVLG